MSCRTFRTLRQRDASERNNSMSARGPVPTGRYPRAEASQMTCDFGLQRLHPDAHAQRKRELPTQGGQARDTARCSGRTEETWSEAAMPICATKTSRGRCVPGSYGAGRDVAVAGQAVQNVDGLATAEVQWPAQFLSKVYRGGADATRAAKGADARAQGGESDQLEDCEWPGCAFLPMQHRWQNADSELRRFRAPASPCCSDVY